MTEIPRYWRLKQQRYRLVGEICENGHPVFPPRDICPDCRGEAKIPYEFSGKGEVYSYTTIYEAPAGYEDNAPYTVALIRLKEGPMITAQLTDLSTHEETKTTDGEPRQVQAFDIKIGMPVEMVTRILKKDGDNGLISYGYKFRPEISSATEVSRSSR